MDLFHGDFFVPFFGNIIFEKTINEREELITL